MYGLFSITDVLRPAAGFFQNMKDNLFGGMADFFGSIAYSLLNSAINIYNTLAQHAVGLLTKSPGEFSSAGMSYVSSLANGAFLTLGTTLVAVFFLIGFFSDSIDVKNEMRFETLLKGALKLSVAEYFTINALSLSKKLFGFVGALVSGNATVKFSLPAAIAKLDDASNNGISAGWAGCCLFLGILAAAVVIVCGLILCYSAYMRFFKIMVMLPYGVLANSTLAGNHTIQHTAVSYWKTMLGVILEAVTMIIAIGLSAKMFSAGTLSLFKEGGSVGETVTFMIIEMVFCPLITVGTVKGAGQLTNKLLGLG